jgi:hypothetical protein
MGYGVLLALPPRAVEYAPPRLQAHEADMQTEWSAFCWQQVLDARHTH